MRIQLLESISGPLGTFRAGDIWDHGDEIDAARIVAAGIAIRVDGAGEHNASQPETPEGKQPKRSKR
jgi:hypothetical protein